MKNVKKTLVFVGENEDASFSDLIAFEICFRSIFHNFFINFDHFWDVFGTILGPNKHAKI